MIFRSHLTVFTLVAACAPLPVLAQGAEAVSGFRNGLKGRIVEQRAQGVDPQRDSANKIDAGYYRLRFEQTAIADAAICPRAAFKSGEEFAKWRSDEGGLYQQIFDKKGVWSLTARVGLRARGSERTSRELRLIAVENPEEKNCKLKIAGSQQGDDDVLDAASLLVPFDPTNTIYEDRLTVAFKSVYKLEPNSQRLDQLWAGINLFATTISAGLGPIVGAATPLGKTETAKLLTTDVETEAPASFEADPGQGTRANRVFVYLGFPPLPRTLPATLTGGMTISLNYQASLFRKGQYYSTTFTQTNPIRANEVLNATPIPAEAAGGNLRTVRQALATGVFDGLNNATSAAGFDGACSTARPALKALDLSEVDIDAFLWAVAARSSHEAVRDHPGKLTCFGTEGRANLAKLGVVVTDEVPPPPPTTQAPLLAMHAAMTSFGGIIQAPPGTPLNPDLTVRFADKIRIVLADDAAQALMPQSEISFERPRDEALTLLNQNFSNIGCFAPRQGSDTLMLPLRPNFFPLPANGRAAAALVLSREATPRPFIFSFGFDPVLQGGNAKIATILIGRRGAGTDDVVKELTVNRRPKSCTETWMNDAFNP
ncbi:MULTISPECIES: hypothetical protein [unclassified Sphingomonas]|uniref:hypothetical protein n=1 Tax=unclassified Sphingomonas TaxID=196159 RepID=UPI0022B44AB3|nr:hypothetical protein [Sphingomonas sp. NIBR02145]WHU01112.1 hypothetical protein O3305_12910 [Sphingomonas sp. NIBR02145]